MFNVCPGCGEYSVEKTIEHREGRAWAICPLCGHAHPFLQQPLFVITGPSGAGKTTVCMQLVEQLRECVVLESDILWGIANGKGDEGYSQYYNTWLRMAKNVGQAGKPVVLCGTALPEHFESCPERRYFARISYCALVCDDKLLVERLQQRPAWRCSGQQPFINEMVKFNRWFKEQSPTREAEIVIYDTGQHSLEQTSQNIAAWVQQKLKPVGEDW